MMKLNGMRNIATRGFCVAMAVIALCLTGRANEKVFTYSYEPETMPAGGMEFEQWVTLRLERNKAVGQQNFARWEFRQELEYGVTDNYTVSLYVNADSQSFRDPGTGVRHSEFSFDGISLENRYLVLNPAEHAIALALYLEPRFSRREAELEQKLILGQRHGKWKWAFNLTHATEWGDHYKSTEGEFEASFGLTRQISKRWSLGFELRDHNEWPDYRQWENTALYLGPVISYRSEKWWAALTVMPQIYGWNTSGDPDGNHRLDLEGHERLNVRLIFGIGF